MRMRPRFVMAEPLTLLLGNHSVLTGKFLPHLHQ